MQFRMRDAVPADIPDLSSVYFSAFANTIVGRHVFPPTSQTSKEFWSQALAEDLENPLVKVLVVVTNAASVSASPENPQPEQVVGFAKWILPGAPIEMPPPAEVWPQDGDPQLAIDFFGTTAAGHKRLMGDRKHWYLELIGVHPEWQRKGAASQMMRWGVARADKDGLPCFLEATPAGKGMYEKYGYRVLEEEKFDSRHGSFTDYYMFRDARTGASGEGANIRVRERRLTQSRQGIAILGRWINKTFRLRAKRLDKAQD